VPTAVFASNPCRIRFCTKEVMFFRDDMVGKMRRNCIRAPSAESSKQIPDLVRSCFSSRVFTPSWFQRSLPKRFLIKLTFPHCRSASVLSTGPTTTPSRCTRCPMLYGQDCFSLLTRALFQLFLGDQHEMFTKKHVDSMYINPGPFATSDFWFMFYFPFTDQVEQSNISLSEDY